MYTGAAKVGGVDTAGRAEITGVGETAGAAAGGLNTAGKFDAAGGFETAGRVDTGRRVAKGSGAFLEDKFWEGLALGVSGLEGGCCCCCCGGLLRRFLRAWSSLSLSDRASTLASANLLPGLAALFQTPPAAFLTCVAYSSSDSASRS